MKFLLSILSSLVLVSGAAFAQSGFYIGGGYGSSKLKSEVLEIVLPSEPPQFSTVKISESDSGWKAYAGYRFGRHFAVEGAYAKLGTFMDEDRDFSIETTLKTKAYDVSLVGFLPLANDRIDLFARGGIAFWDLEASTGPLAGPFADPGFGVEPDDSGQDFVWSLGVQFNLLSNRQLHLRGEYTRYEISGLDKLEYIGGSLGYRF